MANNSNDEKELIVNNLLSAVKQCQIRFGGRSELATDFDERVIQLCDSLEAALSHGLKKNRNLLNYTRKMVMNGITRSSSANLALSESQETNVCFWHFVSLHLNRHEFDRYLLLRNVRTDIGRGKSWLRSALNEHSLERYMLMMLTDNLTIRSQFYEERALLRDEERNSVLPTIARGLGSILFAINIDNSEFDMMSDNNKAIDMNERGDPLPVVCKSLTNNTIGAKKRKTRVNVISLSDDDSDNDNTIHARSAPTTCLSSPDSVFPSSNYETICENSNTTHTNEPKSEFVPIGTDSLGADVVLTPIGGESTNTLNLNIEDDVSDSDKLSCSEQQDLLKLDLNEMFITETINKDKEELDRIRAEMKCLKEKYEEKLIKLETQNETFKKENDVLKMQLKKYIAAVQLLKYGEKKEFDDLSHSSSDKSMSQRLDQSSNFLYINEVNEYEKKLVQVAEMHGELVEFNDHLHRVIQQKEALIKRLKEELVDLRGPFPETSEDIISIASDFETSISIQSSITHPLIHIWIPTAFLAGGQKSKSHHVYQIYVRIKDEEWNVYRRYSQFHSLHKTLRKKYQILNTFDFPPKKTIGNKDSKVVQERRKKLEHYLRSLINYLQTQHNDISDKQNLIQILPFLSERILQTEGRSHSDTQLNLPNTSGLQQQHYMGL